LKSQLLVKNVESWELDLLHLATRYPWSSSYCPARALVKC